MSMERILPLVVAVLYLTTSVLHARKGEMPAAGLWFTYAVGNVCMVWALFQKTN